MKRNVVGGLAFSALLFAAPLGTASAADMPLKAPPPPLAPAWDWSGFYAGGNIGYGFARNPGGFDNLEPVFSPLPERFNYAPAGAIGGGQVGFNWQATPSLVLGVEGDIQKSEQRDSFTCILNCLTIPDVNGTRVEQKLEWFSTLRARAGWTNGPVLFYATGGLAVGRLQTDINTTQGLGTPTEFDFADTRTGWAAGGGFEYRLAGNWTAKAEYLYMDLGSVSHTFMYMPNPITGLPPTTNIYDSQIRDHIVRVGLNYKFWGAPGAVQSGPAPAPVYKAAPSVAAPFNWSGFYVGANVGYGVGRDPSTLWSVFGPNTSGFPPTGLLLGYESFLLSPQGVIGGGQVGVNWQWQHLVFGAEADLQASGQKDNTTCAISCDPTPGGSIALIQQKITSFGTVRGRIGWAEGGWLAYFTGGWAEGNVETAINHSADNGMPLVLREFDFNGRQSGYAIGGGVEAHVVGNLTAKVEYLYLVLGGTVGSFIDPPATTPFGTTNTFTTGIRDHIVRAGLNYKFDWTNPAVGRY